jgi:hypothetical protein
MTVGFPCDDKPHIHSNNGYGVVEFQRFCLGQGNSVSRVDLDCSCGIVVGVSCQGKDHSQEIADWGYPRLLSARDN